MHVHISKGESEAKYNVLEIKMVENHGFKKNELRMIEAIIDENQHIIIEHWNEYFNKNIGK